MEADMKKFVMGIGIFICLLGAQSIAQDVAAETKSEVPELTAFHEVIYPIWHTAYPAKDTKALRDFLTQINALAAKIYGAKLPGILREKEAKWKEGLAQFKTSVDAYNKAAAGKDDPALLTAAEAMHMKYEALVRVLRPVLKEMDEFHQSLYVVNHKFLPEKSYDKIRGAAAELVTKAEAITNAELPAAHKAIADAFKKASADLLAAARALDAAGKAHDHAGMETGVARLHAAYEALQGLFE
jgi:hypothetical protein